MGKVATLLLTLTLMHGDYLKLINSLPWEEMTAKILMIVVLTMMMTSVILILMTRTTWLT